MQPSDKGENLDAKARIERAKKAFANRTNWQSSWREIAELVMPEQATKFVDSYHLNSTGEKIGDKVIDSTAKRAAPKFAAALESIMTPTGQKWHLLRPKNKALMKQKPIAMFMERLNDKLFELRRDPRSNYQSVKLAEYMSIAAYGNGVTYIDFDEKNKVLRYKHCFINDIAFELGAHDRVDTVYRRMWLSARQAVQQFGRENLSEKIVKAYEKHNVEDRFQFIHTVTPREDVNPSRIDPTGLPFASFYDEAEPGHPVLESGYRKFPYPIGRYVVAPGETYARGPGGMVLPEIKLLQQYKRILLKQGHRAMDPVLLMQDDGIAQQFSLRPGAKNYGAVDRKGNRLVHALESGRLDIAQDMIEGEQRVVAEAFLVTLFSILERDRKEMTATEVIERVREKGSLLAPVMGQMMNESLNPQIEREIELILEHNLLGEPIPEEIKATGGLAVVHDSPLARMQRSEEATGFQRTMNMAAEAASITQDPSVLDALNIEQGLQEFAEIQGVPARLMRSPDEIAKRRAERKKNQDAQMAAENLGGAAQMVGALTDSRGQPAA